MENIKLTGTNNFVNQNTTDVSPKAVENEAGAASAGETVALQQPDFQLEVNDKLSAKLLEVAKKLEERQTILSALPRELSEAVNEILQQGGTKAENLSSGLAEVFRQQKNTADTLSNFAEVLMTAAIIKENGAAGEAMTKKLLEQFTTLLPKLEEKKMLQAENLAALKLDVAEEAMVPEDNWQNKEAPENKGVLASRQDLQQKKQTAQPLEIMSFLTDNETLADDKSAALKPFAEKNTAKLNATFPDNPPKERPGPSVNNGVKAKNEVNVDEIAFGTKQSEFKAETIKNQIPVLPRDAEKRAGEGNPESNGDSSQEPAVSKAGKTESLNSQALPNKNDAAPKQVLNELLKLVRNVADNNCEAQLQKLTELGGAKLQTERGGDVRIKDALAALEPKAISFLAERYELPGLKNVWIRQAAKDVLPFVALSKEENQAARQTLQDIGSLVKENSQGPLKPEAKEKLTALIERLPQELQEKLADEGPKGPFQKQIAKLEDTLLLTQRFKDALQPTAAEKYSVLSELKGELNKFLPQGDGAEVADIVKMAKQVALREVLGEQLKGTVAFLEKGLTVQDLKENSAWNALQQNEQSNKSGQRMTETALKLNDPLLAKTVLLLRAAEAAEWRNHSSGELRTAAAAIKELTSTLPKQEAALGARQTEHSVLSFATELQMAQGVIYPAQIHIYHQHPKEKGRQEAGEYETWLRISLETENIGAVTAVFRISEQDRLDVRVGFKVTEALQEFRRQLPELRKSLEGERLKLRDLGGNKI